MPQFCGDVQQFYGVLPKQRVAAFSLVTNDGKLRGQVIPYADQWAYTNRLNALFTPAGWTRKYAIHTSANFERSRDQKVVAKVLVTCELMIFGLGSQFGHRRRMGRQ